MKLIKVKGIVIKEINYSDNDKIITVLTDSLGLISCMAKGAKKVSSTLLASSQFLVYSEFIIFKGTNFYHVNSASTINTFYKLRTDFDKLSSVFELTKLLTVVTSEHIESKEVLTLFLNTLFVFEKMDKLYITDIFKIRLLKILGFTPDVLKCNICNSNLKEKKINVSYNFAYNYFICSNCIKENKKVYYDMKYKTYMNVIYIMYAKENNIFGLVLDEIYQKELKMFSEHFVGCVLANL